MKTYLGVKLIKASTEMSRQEYCDYRGWKLPEDENGEDRVYLVEYEPDGDSKKNHPDHEGYISMSPKEIFEKAYKEVKTFDDIIHKDYIKDNYEKLASHQQRMVGELVELEKKIVALDSFIQDNPIYASLDEKEQELLIQQVRSMSYYFTILVERVNAWSL